MTGKLEMDMKKYGTKNFKFVSIVYMCNGTQISPNISLNFKVSKCRSHLCAVMLMLIRGMLLKVRVRIYYIKKRRMNNIVSQYCSPGKKVANP